jgi:predicted nucleic acid-binding protein
VRPVLLDTSVIVALFNRSEERHAECVAAVENLEQSLVTCEAVITESCYLLRRVKGAPEVILENVEQSIFQIPFQLSQSAEAVRTIMRKHRDIPADFADACLIHLAEVLGTGEILTLDRDFLSYRWRRTHRFELLVTV